MTENGEFIKGITKRIIKSLTPKEVKVLDRLRLSNKEIAKELGSTPGGISQILHMLYSTRFYLIVDFKGTKKKTALMMEWQRIRKQYRIELASKQFLEKRKTKMLKIKKLIVRLRKLWRK